MEYQPSGSDTWQPAGTGFTLVNSHEFACEPGLVTCRVAALAAVRGDWAEIEVNAGGDFDTPGQVQPELAEPFTGESLKVVWAKEPAAARYLVEVWSAGTFCRSAYLERDTVNYGYHYSDAQKDSSGRTLTVKVRAQNAEGINGEFGEVTATNQPPDVPDNVEVTGLLDSLIVKCDDNNEPDVLELRIYGEQESGFVPGAGNLLARSPTSLVNVPVPVNTHWYVRLGWVDVWGTDDLNFSGEYEATAEKIDETVIGEDSISTPLLKANAVTTEKLAAESVTADKIEAGVITGEHIESGSITAEDAVFESGAIQNADIGNVIKSNNYEAEKSGWMINKSGFAEFSNIYARGSIDGSIIRGSVIEGGMMIQSDIQITTPTEADMGPGTIRYLSVATINEQVASFNGDEQNEAASPLLPIPSANYTAEGYEDYGDGEAREPVYVNMNRYLNYEIEPVCFAAFRVNASRDVTSMNYRLTIIGVQYDNTETDIYTGDWYSVSGYLGDEWNYGSNEQGEWRAYVAGVSDCNDSSCTYYKIITRAEITVNKVSCQFSRSDYKGLKARFEGSVNGNVYVTAIDIKDTLSRYL